MSSVVPRALQMRSAAQTAKVYIYTDISVKKGDSLLPCCRSRMALRPSQTRGKGQDMTPEKIDLVQKSFEKVAPISEVAASLFYGRLFEIAPHVRPMFKDDVTDQGRKLMRTLSVVVNGLDNLEAIVPVAQSLATKHIDYGVKPEHYQSVGEALLWTLAKGLGEDFDTETRCAWEEAFSLLAGVMIDAAYARNPARPMA